MNLLHVTIRSPRALIWEGDVRSLRVPTESGQVGLRGRCEATVLAIEAGLIQAHQDQHVVFLGTAGGLLTTDGQCLDVATPMAVVGNNRQEVLKSVEEALQVSNEETEARQLFSRLQESIFHELSESSGQFGQAVDKLR